MLSTASKIDTRPPTVRSSTSPSTAATAKNACTSNGATASGPGRQALHRLYNTHFQEHNGFDEMIVAFSRPKNL
jgi:hypothetical protein